MAVEEQTVGANNLSLYNGSLVRGGQRLTIAGRLVTKLRFKVYKSGGPTGDVFMRIRKIDNTLLLSKLWGQAADLGLSAAWKEVVFDTPLLIDEEVRIATEFYGGNSLNRVRVIYAASQEKADELQTDYTPPSWTDRASFDMTYSYTYELPALGGGGGPAPLLVAQGVI